MSRKAENTGFVCRYCGMYVFPLTNGSYRNHCPHCLYSLHVDENIGDRASNCFGIMEPIKGVYHGKKGYQIIHRCLACGVEKTNKIAQDTEMPDNFDLIIKLLKKSAEQ